MDNDKMKERIVLWQIIGQQNFVSVEHSTLYRITKVCFYSIVAAYIAARKLGILIKLIQTVNNVFSRTCVVFERKEGMEVRELQSFFGELIPEMHEFSKHGLKNRFAMYVPL